MSKKKLKRVVGLTTALSLTTNTLSYAAIGTTGNQGIDYETIVKTLGEDLVKAPKQSTQTSKISELIDTKSDEVISVIVEFVSEPLATTMNSSVRTYSDAESKVARDHKLFESFLEKLPMTLSDSPIEITQSYSIVYNGVALKIKASDVGKLLSSGVVKKIHADTEVTFDTTLDTKQADDVVEESGVASEVEGTETLTEEVDALEGNEVSPYMMDSVPFLDVDRLHQEGINGKGIKVGVLDTGIDYNHPDLTAAYKGFRAENGDAKQQDMNVVKGWDFIDNDADPMETTYTAWQGSGQPEYNSSGTSYYTSHGTHVSGTIAGQQDAQNHNAVLGVAPEVDLYAYRVLGPYGSGTTSGLVAAVEKSVKDGMDIINMSLGSSAHNDPFNPLVDAVNNATLAGVIPVIASGNSGSKAETIDSPGTAQLPITVGASTADVEKMTFDLLVGGQTINASVIAIDLGASIKTLSGKFEMVYCGSGSESEFEGKDLKGKVAVIDTVADMFDMGIENVKNAGASLAILINNGEDPFSYLGELVGVHSLALSLDQGKLLKEHINEKITLTPGKSVIEKGDQLTDFSSVGPVKTTIEIRPDVVAPGSLVFSTVPEYMNDPDEGDKYELAYRRMSGTSMATPHVSGIVALILQANPNYTPIDVKAALMNTAEIITPNEEEGYSVHQIGAGRVNPYAAVYEKVAFTANYTSVAGADYTTIDNTTSMLSFGKMYNTSKELISKTIPVTIKNNSDSEKIYNVVVKYTKTDRALSAADNGVNVKVVNQVTVPSNGSQTFDVTMEIPTTATYGNYEGYIYFTEVGNEANDYQMPFSATFSKEGIVALDYPEISEGSAKGATAFNTSALLNKHTNTVFTGSDIGFSLTVSEQVSKVSTYVKDQNGTIIGFGGSRDGSWIPKNKPVTINDMVQSGRVYKMVDGKVSHEQMPLEQGIYELEVVVETLTGKEFKDSLPMAIINDTKTDKVTFNINDQPLSEGIIEVNDSLYSTEFWQDGRAYEAIWVRANVYNGIVNQLKEKGLDYLKQSELNSIFAYANYSNGNQTKIGTMAKDDDNVLISGIKKQDLADGYFHLKLDYANAGTVTNRPSHFVFVNPETQYLSISTDITKLTENSEVTAVISANNVQDLAKGQLTLKNTGNATLKIKSIVPTEALKNLVGSENVMIEHSRSTVDKYSQEFNLSFALPENAKGLMGDVALFDVVFEVEEFRGVAEDLVDDEQFLYTTLTGQGGSFKNKKDETLDVKTGTLVHSFDLESVNRTLIYGAIDLPVKDLEGGKLVAISPDGTRYEPTYLEVDELTEKGYLFAFNDLPVIDGEYTIVYTLPGAFNSVIKVPGSKINAADERVGNLFGMMNYTITGKTALYPILGDVNGDGAIDIMDATLIGKEYQSKLPQTLSAHSSTADITQDGVVNSDDMKWVIKNYLSKDLTRSDAATPQEYYNGNDLYDILEACGYFDEQPENNVTLELNREESTVGEQVVLTATPSGDGSKFEYEFSVREASDSEWTVIREKAKENEMVWTPEVAGEYAVKVRVSREGTDYVWQDNKVHTVHKKSVVIPSELQGQLDTAYLLPVEGNGTKESPLVIEVNSDVNDEKAKEALEKLFAGYEVKVELKSKDGVYHVNLVKGEESHFLIFNIGELKQAVMTYLNSLIMTEPEQPIEPDQPTNPNQPTEPDQPTDPSQPETEEKPGDGSINGGLSYSIPSALVGVYNVNYLHTTSGDGTEKSPLVIEVAEGSDQANVKESLVNLFKGYTVSVEKSTVDGKVIYQVTLVKGQEKYYLTIHVDSSNKTVIEYLDNFISTNNPNTGFTGGLTLLALGGALVTFGAKTRKKRK